MRKRARPASVPGPIADVSARYADAFLGFAATLRPSSSNAIAPATRIEGPRVDGARFCEWVAHAVRATSDEAIGFRFGASVTWRAYGLLGIAAASAPTLREALGRVVRWQPLVDTLGTLRISDRGSLLHLQWRAAIDVPHAVVASILSGWLCFIRNLAAGPMPADALELACAGAPPPGNAESIVGCRVRFAACENAVVVPASVLGIRSRFADDRMHASIERVLDDHLALVGAGTDAACRRALAAMRAGLHAGGARQPRAAAEAGVSRRTLQRRLAARGTDYRRLLDAMRADVALHALCADDESFVALAHGIGFDEQATFSRAVRRWTGRTPREIRSRFGGEFRARQEPSASAALAQSDKYTVRGRC